MGSDSPRLFFALWPDAELRTALVQTGRDRTVPRSRPVAPDNLHLTLAFLGAIADPLVDAVHAAAGAVSAPPIDFDLDRIELWPRPQLLCATATKLPEALQTLVTQLRTALASRDLPTETRPLRAHVTLVRKVRRQGQPMTLPAPLRWHAERFWLVTSESRPEGVRYTPVRSWTLTQRG